ncbi:GH3 auxin-responsive promoter family protein [Nonlabens ponticola]|uniref:GH3 auxin-responsive promoter family protein n=1 Tax=Nonlabens ponticola TaxID=2496866 RepID=A0A3S9MVS5_9FLAO|nr:GH3 auxin-responsive promoter family protein [Nonlabens ponticola]AZQ43326.1 GH3 auxin-responsive promoter family protein [Nonlabens ponticola]
MAIPLINSVVSWFLKKRIHDMELFMKHPQELQDNLLGELISHAKNTEVGKKYGFESITSYDDFKNQVPITEYADVQDLLERSRAGESNIFWPEPIKYFAMSSGTTSSRSKYIPVSEQSLQDCHYAAAKDLLCMYLNNNPESQLFTGKGLRLGGSKKLDKAAGTAAGDLSSILIDNMPFWADYSSTPSNEVALMADWETKMPAIVQETIHEKVTSLAGVPSWMMVLLNNVLETTGKDNILEVWPDMEVFFHGGVSFDPYVEPFKKLLPDSEIKYYETYNASEGFFAIQDQNDSKDLLLMLDYGIFYEFLPMSTYGTAQEKVVTLDQVELGENYAIVITTNAGLWRYKIGDTVRFTSASPYRIKVTGRTKHHINVFGEELIIENAEEALKKTMQEVPCSIKDYTVAPIFMEGKEKGAHEWLIEFEQHPKDEQLFKEVLDQQLQQVNSDYAAKRYMNTTLSAPTIHVAAPQTFYHWLKSKNKLGGQHKIPRLSNSRDYLDELLKIHQSAATASNN